MKSNRVMVKFVSFRILVSFLCVLSALCVKISAQEFKTLKDGIEYAEVTQEISGLKVNMNLLRLDLTKVRLDVNHAMDAAIGTEKTSLIATRHGAFAAINAGFFRLDQSKFAGDPAGILMIDGELLSESVSRRIALILTENKENTDAWMTPISTQTWINIGNEFGVNISGINRERKSTEIILYTPQFGKTSPTEPGGTEVVLEECNNAAKPFLTKNLKCRRYEIRKGGNTEIPNNGRVISFANEVPEDARLFMGRLTLDERSKRRESIFLRSSLFRQNVTLIVNGKE